MAIVYEKLMALDVPAAEQTYGPKDCMLYALGIGLGHERYPNVPRNVNCDHAEKASLPKWRASWAC